jgi:hypothetical protein
MRSIASTHVLDHVDISALVALADEKVLLSVRLAHVRNRKRVGIDNRLRNGLDLKQVKRKARSQVDEVATDWFICGVEVNGIRTKTLNDLPFG